MNIPKAIILNDKWSRRHEHVVTAQKIPIVDMYAIDEIVSQLEEQDIPIIRDRSEKKAIYTVYNFETGEDLWKETTAPIDTIFPANTKIIGYALRNAWLEIVVEDIGKRNKFGSYDWSDEIGVRSRIIGYGVSNTVEEMVTKASQILNAFYDTYKPKLELSSLAV